MVSGGKLGTDMNNNPQLSEPNISSSSLNLSFVYSFFSFTTAVLCWAASSLIYYSSIHSVVHYLLWLVFS